MRKLLSSKSENMLFVHNEKQFFFKFMGNHLNFSVRHNVYYLVYYLSLQRYSFFLHLHGKESQTII